MPSADARKAWSGAVSSEADAPSLFEGTSTAKPKTAQKTAKRGKLYGSDDAAWESEVRKDLAKKKTGTVDNAVSKRVAEVSQEVASYRATATAAVDAFVALSNAGAFSIGNARRVGRARGARRGGAGSERIDGLRRDRHCRRCSARRSRSRTLTASTPC